MFEKPICTLEEAPLLDHGNAYQLAMHKPYASKAYLIGTCFAFMHRMITVSSAHLTLERNAQPIQGST